MLLLVQLLLLLSQCRVGTWLVTWLLPLMLMPLQLAFAVRALCGSCWAAGTQAGCLSGQWMTAGKQA